MQTRKARARPALPNVLVAGNDSASCDAVERILSPERGFDVVHGRTIGAALAALQPANGGTPRYFDCCVLAREFDGSTLEIAEAAASVRPEPLLLALESARWSDRERLELEGRGAHFVPVPLAPHILLDLLEHGARDPVLHFTGRYGLSPRRYQVLSLGVRGAGDPQIAEILGISESTVDDHWKATCRQVGVAGRVELIAQVARDLAKRCSWPPLPALSGR